jgi:ubiquinone/menaquinone biosynthesis C-methylase UbiE
MESIVSMYCVKDNNTQDYKYEYERKNVKGTYSKIANEFHKTRRNTWEWIERFISFVPDGGQILDVGCGGGRNMKVIHPTKKHHFTGVDSCQKFVDICRDDGLDVYKSCMTNMPFESDAFDALLCIASFHHLASKERREDALLEMRRVVKDGGYILLSVWSKEQPESTKRVFENYGDNLVPWKSKSGKVYERYYYIFEHKELYKLFYECGLTCVEHKWDYGNEIFVLHNM